MHFLCDGWAVVMSRLTARQLRGHESGGQTLVEFALVVPLVILLFLILFDFGRAVYGLTSVGNAAREGVRTAIVNQNLSEVRQRAADQATSLGVDSSGSGCWSLSADTGVCVRFDGPDGSIGGCPTVSVGCIAEVKVRWTYRPITPIVGQIVPAIPFESITKQPIEALCATAGACPIP